MKQASCLQWIQESGTCHTLKDLEKTLPSVASINGIQVKDYIQALSDDNLIRVEKIGSGNWYWSFPSEEKLKREDLLNKAQADRGKANVTLERLRSKIEETQAARDGEDEEQVTECQSDRENLTARQSTLAKELQLLRMALAAYSENDPVEMEKRKELIRKRKAEAEKWTEQIQTMEEWFRKHAAVDRERFLLMKQNWYGDEFDEDEGCLREI